jgi:integrase
VENRAHVQPDGSTRWTFRVRWTDPVTGRRLSETFHRQEDAVAFHERRRDARHSGQLEKFDGGRTTFARFVEEWWTTYVLVELESGTWPSYRRTLDRHVLPVLGPLELRQIYPETLIRWRARMTEQGIGAPTIRKAMAIAQSVLTRAVEWSRIPANPGREVRKPARVKKAVRPLPPLDVERIRRELPTLRDRALVSVLAYSGLRPEEALALQWHHIGQRTIVIEQKNVDGTIVLGQKTKRPPRSVHLLAPLGEDLDAYRPADAAGGMLVFPGEAGLPWSAATYDLWRSDVFAPVADRLHGRPTSRDVRAAVQRARRRPDDSELRANALRLQQARQAQKGVRPYDLRHSFASLLIHEGRLSVAEIAEQMGHSIPTLLTTYTHVIQELRDAEKVPAAVAIQAARDQLRDNADAMTPVVTTAQAPEA